MQRFCATALIVLVGIICFNPAHGMSEAQVKNAVKLVRNVCQPKFKVTNAQIENMHKGIFDADSKQACYMSCGLHALKFMKNGKMDYDFAKGQVKSLPPNWQTPVDHSIEACKDSAVSDDKCEASYQLAQCMYKAEPDYYFLP